MEMFTSTETIVRNGYSDFFEKVEFLVPAGTEDYDGRY